MKHIPYNLTLLTTLALLSFHPCEANAIREALTFHASFDNGLQADFAKGDPAIYTVAQLKPEVIIRPGIPEEVVVTQEGGRFGHSLSFNTPEEIQGTRAFYKAAGNFPFSDNNWSGTVSFWLRVTPDEDLRPGFTDPIQITPRSALDSCLWIDFDKEIPREMRMGAFPDKVKWNPSGKSMGDIPAAEKPWIQVKTPPFSRDRWTHIAFTFEGFNNPGKDGVAKLYLDGQFQGALSGFEQMYTWNMEECQIRLGVNYVGHFDELSCFDRALNAGEIATLHSLKGGVKSLLAK